MEIWRDIPNYEGLYQVSDLGRVKSLIGKEKLLKFGISSNYYHVTLFKSGGKSFRVHQLVAMAFLDHKTDGTHKVVVDHIDNNSLNNCLDNLQLISHRLNSSKNITNKTSKYTGVSWDKNRNKWRSCITINGNKKHLGYFKNEKEASEVYQKELNKITKKANEGSLKIIPY